MEISSDDDDDRNNGEKKKAQQQNHNENNDDHNDDAEEEKKEQERLAKNPDLVTLPMVELVLRSFRFQATNPAAKAGNRLLRSQLLVGDVESHIDIIVQVIPPLLTNPEWFVSRHYVLGVNNPNLFPTVVAPNLKIGRAHV